MCYNTVAMKQNAPSSTKIDKIDDYKRLLTSCLQVGLPILSLDTCARVAAIVHSSNSEMVTHCPKLLADLDYIQKRFRIEGSEVPDAAFVVELQSYVQEIKESFEKTKAAPQWCNDFCQERYGVKLF